MPEIALKLSDEYSGKSKEEISKLFDQEVENFSKFMSTIGDWKSVGPLNSGERSLIKTYLIQKYKESF